MTIYYVFYAICDAVTVLSIAVIIYILSKDRRAVLGLVPGDRIELSPYWRVKGSVVISKHVWEKLRKNGYMAVIAVDGGTFTAAYEPKPGIMTAHDEYMDYVYHLGGDAIGRVVKKSELQGGGR